MAHILWASRSFGSQYVYAVHMESPSSGIPKSGTCQNRPVKKRDSRPDWGDALEVCVCVGGLQRMNWKLLQVPQAARRSRGTEGSAEGILGPILRQVPVPREKGANARPLEEASVTAAPSTAGALAQLVLEGLDARVGLSASFAPAVPAAGGLPGLKGRGCHSSAAWMQHSLRDPPPRVARDPCCLRPWAKGSFPLRPPLSPHLGGDCAA